MRCVARVTCLVGINKAICLLREKTSTITMACMVINDNGVDWKSSGKEQKVSYERKRLINKRERNRVRVGESVMKLN